MGVQTMGSHGGGGGGGSSSRRQSQFQTLPGETPPYTLSLNGVHTQSAEPPLQNINLNKFLPGTRLVDLGIASSRYALGSANGGHGALARELSGSPSDRRDLPGEGRPVAGEMTLEDYLAKASAADDGSRKSVIGDVVSDRGSGVPAEGRGYLQGVHWMQQQQQSVEGAYRTAQNNSSQLLMGAVSDTQTPGRKRVALGDVPEKTVERKQKRMIKNRESAARSRARKQAYTNELENKILLLEEENERLKRQKELDRILYNPPAPEPMFRLRRTNSATF